MTDYTVYEELIYGDQEDGSCQWTGRLYRRGRPTGVAANIEGKAPNREKARDAFRVWRDATLPNYEVPSTAEVTIK